jgi:hypothetical protein
MTYGFVRDVPINETQYAEVKSAIGKETPKGLVAHLVVRQSGSLRYIDVWDRHPDCGLFLTSSTSFANSLPRSGACSTALWRGSPRHRAVLAPIVRGLAAARAGSEVPAAQRPCNGMLLVMQVQMLPSIRISLGSK